MSFRIVTAMQRNCFNKTKQQQYPNIHKKAGNGAQGGLRHTNRFSPTLTLALALQGLLGTALEVLYRSFRIALVSFSVQG